MLDQNCNPQAIHEYSPKTMLNPCLGKQLHWPVP